MPTPPASDAPDDRTALEPIRVLRMRNTDTLAQLLDDIGQDEDYRGRLPDQRDDLRARLVRAQGDYYADDIALNGGPGAGGHT